MAQQTTFSRKDITLANWRQHPFSQWSFQNVGELVPTAEITAPRGTEDLVAEPGLIASLSIVKADGESMTALEHLKQSHADRFVMMRDGVVLDEWLAPHAEAERPHVIYSVSKSVTGMLAGIAVGDGRLDPDAGVTDYVEVKRGSAYHAARVRDLLDMTVSLDFVENYLDKDGDFDRYRRAMLWNPERAGAKQETMLEVLASLKPRAHPHGTIYYYASPNTDMLGLVIEAAVGQRFHAYLADRLWATDGRARCGPRHGRTGRSGARRRRHLRDRARPRPFRPAGAGRRLDRATGASWSRSHGSPTCARTATARPGARAMTRTSFATAATAPAGTTSATNAARSARSAFTANGSGSTRSAASCSPRCRRGRPPATMPRRAAEIEFLGQVARGF